MKNVFFTPQTSDSEFLNTPPGVNLAFNIKCSFSKSETKWLRNKDVGQQNAHHRESITALHRHKCGLVWPFTPKQTSGGPYVILNHPPHWACTHTHTHLSGMAND